MANTMVSQTPSFNEEFYTSLYGVEEGQISADQRRVGKTINFGVIYGMSAFRLARDMRISRRDADEFIRRYFQRYAGVDRFIKQTISRAEQQGYVETIMGRRRPVSRINSRNASVYWESGRNVDLIHTFLKRRHDVEGDRDPELMRWLDRNPLVEFHAIERVFNPAMKEGEPVAAWFPYTISM